MSFAAVRRSRLAFLASSLGLLLAGCAGLDAPRAPGPAARPAPAERAAPRTSEAPGGRKLAPMAVVPFSVRTDCSYRDETGASGSARLDVVDSEVRSFAATLDIPNRGRCRFDLAQFRQTRRLPSIELTGPAACRVRMWEQGEQITVAFAGCHAMCSPQTAQDYLWPLLIDRKSGECD